MVIFGVFFVVLVGKYPFLFEYTKFYSDVHFFYFRPFLRVLSKNQFGILMLPD